jgi:carbonic anhydrase
MRSRFAQGALPVLASAVLLAACSSTAPTTSAPPAPVVSERHWGYASNAETAGPAEWGSLPGNAACAAGKRQSPVDLATRAPFPVEAKDLPNLVFKYGTTKLHLVNNGHTVQADVDAGSTVEIDGGTWALLQLHFHAPSEHSLDGLHYPMEMHLVHAGADGKPGLVVGVFLVQGGDNPAFTPLLSDLPKVKGARKNDSSVSVDLAKLLPGNRAYLAYDGSLTTPPCTEGVLWIVMKQPVQASAEQIDLFSRLYPMNARPVQSVAGRMIKESN